MQHFFNGNSRNQMSGTEMDKKQRNKNRIAVLFLTVCVLALSGCQNSSAVSAEAGSSAVVVEMQTVQRGDLTLQNSFVGTIMSKESVYVIPFASGTVTEVNYGVGDYVNEGDVLFKIDDEAAQLQLRQAELTYKNAKQQADMATGSQQTSADLQLESNKIQVQSSFEQAQIAYFQLLNSYNDAEKAVSELQAQVDENKKKLDENQKKLDETQKKIDDFGSVTVSGGNANLEEFTVLQQDLSTLQSQKTTLQAQQTLLEYQLGEAKSGFQQLKDAIPQAESGYRAAEAAVKLMEETEALTQGSVRDDTNAQLNTGLQLAQLGVDSARLALSYYTMTAPIGGVITSCGVSVNGIATSSSPAFVISGGDGMKVTFNVGESVKNTLNTGDAITVERGGITYTGHVTEIGIAVNQQTGLFLIDADVNASSDVLPSGVSVKITADTYREKDSVVIPYDAVYYDNEGAYVYLSVENKAVKTRVKVGIFNDHMIVVTDGIKEGDTLITSWSAKLLDGVDVVAK